MTKSKRYYVSMKDTFMSGWGMAEGKSNYLVVKCPSVKWARLIQDFVERNRHEMRRVLVSPKRRADTRSIYTSTGKFSDWARQVRREGQA